MSSLSLSFKRIEANPTDSYLLNGLVKCNKALVVLVKLSSWRVVISKLI
jgi:hypothetical protein